MVTLPLFRGTSVPNNMRPRNNNALAYTWVSSSMYASKPAQLEGNFVQSIRSLSGPLVLCILAALTPARHASAHSVWVQQAADVQPTAFVSQAPTHLRQSFVRTAAAPSQPRRVRQAVPARQQEAPPVRREVILDFGDILDTSRLPSVREGVRVLGSQR